MFTEIVKGETKPRRGPGRPRGRTKRGTRTRERMYRAAIQLMTRRGYDQTTLRDVADAAGVSAGLLYRYFPSKRAVVLALYDELSAGFAERAPQMPAGRWRDRFIFALRTSLEVLAPHRGILSALIPVLIGDPEEGLFAPRTAFSRSRVQTVFHQAVTGASDAPKGDLAGALGRLLYLVHLGVVLWWLLDKSPGQRATRGLVALIERGAAMVSVALRLPPVRGIVRSGDALFRDALFGGGPAG